MITNLDIDNELIQETLTLSGHRTKHVWLKKLYKNVSKDINNLKSLNYLEQFNTNMTMITNNYVGNYKKYC